MSAKEARQRYVQALWDGLDVDDQWSLLFGVDRGLTSDECERLDRLRLLTFEGRAIIEFVESEKCLTEHGGVLDLTPLGGEVRAYGKQIYDSLPD